MTLKTSNLNVLSENAAVLNLFMPQILIIWLYQFHVLHVKNKIKYDIQLYWKLYRWLTNVLRVKYLGCYPLLPKAYLMHKISKGMLICH